MVKKECKTAILIVCGVNSSHINQMIKHNLTCMTNSADSDRKCEVRKEIPGKYKKFNFDTYCCQDRFTYLLD